MKRKLKSIFIISTIISIPVLINYLIFKSSEKQTSVKPKDFNYKWTFGNIKYTISGEGKPLFLLHDTTSGSGKHEWDNNIKTLSENYKVYALDLIGFGYSDKPGISYSPYLYVKLINDFIKEIIQEKVNVIANGNTAAFTVAAYNFEPDNYDKVMLISPSGIGAAKNPPATYNKWLQMVLDSPILGTSIYNLMNSKFAIKKYLESSFYSNNSKITKKWVNKYYASAHFGGANAKYSASTFIANFLNIDIERLFSNIKTPIHIAWGEKNELNPVSNAKYIKKINPSVQLSTFKNTKALPHAENFKAFNDICYNFFG